ncbi:hypothetical protein GIB67_037954 [Kingdonia uniflora]|uniref:Agenet domain-containing protein n=1 Tax=Kingdonia uniflora TaxID=39325 RepID=A0A7J7LH55_9MAGN|nr:hypothetical protein GIB67_037954 [Kingdonia uniflora]
MRGKQLGDVMGFSIGQPVEVRMDDEGFEGAWYSAKIVQLSLESPASRLKSKLFVMYDNLSTEADGKGVKKPLTEHVHVSNIRPIPPKEEDPTFGINEVVDVYYNDGWWKGDIIEVLEDSVYVAYFSIRGEKLEVERRNLRVHLEWIDGRWVLPEELQKQKEQQTVVSYLNVIKPPNYEEFKQVTPISEKKGKFSKEKFKNPNPFFNGIEFLGLKKCQVGKVSHIPCEKHLKLSIEQKELLDDRTTQKNITSTMNPSAKKTIRKPTNKRMGDQISTLSSKRGRTESPTASMKSPTEGQKSNNATDEQPPRQKDDNCTPSLQVSPSQEFSCTTNKAKASEDGLSEEPETSFDNFSFLNVVPVDCIPERETSERNEVHVKSATADLPLLEFQLESENLPFVRKSSMWEIVQDFDVFQQMPQKPHFRPLEMFHEQHREGHAIGLMITFSTVVETTFNSRLDTPMSVFEGSLKVLADLELHGFEVQKVRTRIEELLKRKDSRVLLEKESKTVKGEIFEVNVEVGKYEVEINEVSKSIREATKLIRELEENVAKLMGNHESLMMKMLSGGSHITNLQKEVDLLQENIRKIENEFYEVAASSW